MVAIPCAVSYAQPDSQAPVAAAPATATCPGTPAPAPLATGVYTAKPVPDITINGQPATVGSQTLINLPPTLGRSVAVVARHP